MNVAVVVPAYQAARHLRRVLERVLGVPDLAPGLVVVVDDGSTDDTRAVALAMHAVDRRVTLVARSLNGGYGAAMKDGLARAAEANPDVVACVHADGQYSPESLPALVRERNERRLDVLQGSRISSGTALSGGMPLYKYAANAVLNRVENHTLGLSMTDYHSGYLLYGKRALRELPFARLSDSFDFDLEVIASARARGLAVGEAPVPTHYGNEVSHLNPVTYGLRVLRVMWRYRTGRYDAV
ncbi:MAG TPA: glycosyltransferase family 2 protein [Polyangiaceae bacterium]|jgi:glycosyltransferase involved in cell wall biosynthesis|nr:glycosyltransferase family 2 protein [Polyangiaceae bacterium]